MSRLVLFQLVSLFVIGAIITLMGLAGLIYPQLSLLLVIPVFILLKIVSQIVFLFKDLLRWEKALIAVLIFIWLLHLLQVFVPETGFDAVWYHLPIVKQFVDHHQIFYLEEFYQSVNPLFSDLIFLLGFQIGGDGGSKLVAYLFGVTLILVSYQLSRQFINRSWSLLTVLIISTFQVVAWQSASFYIDVAKAMWEIASIWLLIKGNTKTSALMFGASLATKLFSLLLYPLMLVNVWLLSSKRTLKIILIYLGISLSVALPFYLFTYSQVGNPLYSLTLHTQHVASHFWFDQTLKLPTSLVALTLSSDYTTALFLILLPIFIDWLLEMKKTKREIALIIFSMGQYMVWWYIPPASTRYALSGFITLLILLMVATKWLIIKKESYRLPLLSTIAILTLFSLAPRFLVAKRSLTYILGKQTKQQYVQQFYDGWIDDPLKKWYRF